MTERMNVLFIVLDDLRPELSCYGKIWIQSPHIDSLAAEGVLFERSYCQQAVCAPSRASLLSGCRPDTTGIYGLVTPLRRAMPDVLTLPQHFKRNGYETLSIGKVYHHARDDLEGWTRDPFRSRGDWKGRGYLTDEAIEKVAICNRREEKQSSSRRGLGPAYEAADVSDEGYQDGKEARRAVEELRDLKDREKPFFLGLGFHKPHLPFNSPKKYWELYRHEEVPLAPNPYEPEGVTEYSLTNFGELRGYFDMPEDGPIGDETARDLVHAYAACVSYVDAQVGKVLDELQRLGLEENTVVVLWGDHGWKLGEHGSWCKHTNFEIDTRAPLIVRAPGRGVRGERRSEIVEFLDIYPTLCELCGLEVPPHCEGRSFGPLLGESGGWTKTAAFSQYPRGDVMGNAVRTDRYRYVEWMGEDREVQARELYDHNADPAENVNVAADPEWSQTVKKMQERLRRVLG